MNQLLNYVLVTFSDKNIDQRTYDWIIYCSLRVPLLARRRKLNYPTGKVMFVNICTGTSDLAVLLVLLQSPDKPNKRQMNKDKTTNSPNRRYNITWKNTLIMRTKTHENCTHIARTEISAWGSVSPGPWTAWDYFYEWNAWRQSIEGARTSECKAALVLSCLD